MFGCLSIYPPVYPHLHLSITCFYVNFCLYNPLSVYLSVYLSPNLSSMHLASIFMSACLSCCLSSSSVLCGLSVYMSWCLSICMCVYSCVYHSVWVCLPVHCFISLTIHSFLQPSAVPSCPFVCMSVHLPYCIRLPRGDPRLCWGPRQKLSNQCSSL